MERRAVDVGATLKELKAMLMGSLRKQVSLVLDAAPLLARLREQNHDVPIVLASG